MANYALCIMNYELSKMNCELKIYILLFCCLFASCNEIESLQGADEEQQQLINVGGVTLTDELEIDASTTVTRAAMTRAADPVDAETQKWLIGPLKSGLDITYGKVGDASTANVAILKLTGGTADDYDYDKDQQSGYAVYTFKYRGTESDAYWHGNGAHYFEGVYVPNAIRYGTGTGETSRKEISSVNTTSAPSILSDQSSDTNNGNYTLLERYLGMPANTKISATVGRIRLPFRHRLCRVQAYVLIDPAMGNGVKLDGYMEDGTEGDPKEDPHTTKISFCNVQVLEGVKDELEGDKGHHTLTPQWKEQRKVVPHYYGEEVSRNSSKEIVDENDFIVYFNINTDTYIFPVDDNKWTAARTAYNNALSNHNNNESEAEKACHYRRINYGKVPVYDIIARPTYTTLENVMYDEEEVKNSDGTENKDKKTALLNQHNRIFFDITLNNGLQYTKEFEFDLDANYETAVFLRISRESIDYNSSGSELWIPDVKTDDWYGVDNDLDHSLSFAGSSWQRAFIAGATVGDDKITDGGFYNETTTGEDGTSGQYLTNETWINTFAQAYEGGAHHGDYFALKNNITIDASQLPIGFVFTGHLDAQDHTITLTGTNQWAECSNEVLSLLRDAQSDEAHVPQLYSLMEVAQAPGRREASTRAIEYEAPVEVDMTKTTPADLNPTLTYLYKDAEGKYHEYTNRTFYKMTGSALFYGLNGNYSTKQEALASPYTLPAVEWEANVHKEGNNWVPYRTADSDFAKGQGSGWRAEILNLKLAGKLFTDDAKITGNVQNCFEGSNGNIKVVDHVPAMPKY